MNQKRVTLADVARLAGLSQTAASMILTGRSDTRLSAEAHARVHAAVAELGYRPNVAARALRTDRSRSIAFISDYVATTRFANGLIRGALTAADAAHNVMMVLETGGEPARATRAIEAALDRQVDGVIFASMRSRELFVPDLQLPVPVVMLNGTNARFPVCVLPDEFQGGRVAVRQMAESGIVSGLVLIGYNPVDEKGLYRSETISRRLSGIAAEMQARGLVFDAQLSSWEWEIANGYEMVRRLLKKTRPKGLLCLNDRLAFGAYQALAEAGLAIPTDVALMSFDNDDIASGLRPGLTTVALPHDEMGRRAVERLLGTPVPGEELVPMQVVVRGSLPKPPAAPTAGT